MPTFMLTTFVGLTNGALGVWRTSAKPRKEPHCAKRFIKQRGTQITRSAPIVFRFKSRFL
eukprot:4670301-Amphidinium_carterae.1